MTQRDWQKDFEGARVSLIAAVDRADAAEIREQRLKEAAEKVRGIYKSEYTDEEAVNVINDMFQALLPTLYPDTPAPYEPKNSSTARPIDEWHEALGCVIWWNFPIEEPPYCGTPLDIDWPDYHTHWTPIFYPDTPAPLPKEGRV